MRWVSELNKGSGDVVSKAEKKIEKNVRNSRKIGANQTHTSAVIELGGDTNARLVLCRKGEVGFSHSWPMLIKGFYPQGFWRAVAPDSAEDWIPRLR